MNSSTTIPDTGFIALLSGMRQYELTNHLGNVLATVSDRRLQRFDDTLAVDYYEADVLMVGDYFSFGAPLPGREFYVDKGYR